VEFNAPVPPSAVEDEPFANNGVSMSDYCRFAQVVQSMLPIYDIECDFNLGVELSSARLMETTKTSFCIRIMLNGVTWW